MNNSIIQDVYFNAFYCYSRNFWAIKSWSCIYCGSSDIYCDPCQGSRENTRCRKSVNLTIIIILLGTLMLKKNPLTRKLSSKRGKILRAYMYEERYNIYMQISKVFFGGVINHQFLLLLIRFASVCTNCNINSGNTIVIFGLYCCLARVIVIYTGRDMLRTPSSYRDLYSLAWLPVIVQVFVHQL